MYCSVSTLRLDASYHLCSAHHRGEPSQSFGFCRCSRQSCYTRVQLSTDFFSFSQLVVPLVGSTTWGWKERSILQSGYGKMLKKKVCFDDFSVFFWNISIQYRFLSSFYSLQKKTDPGSVKFWKLQLLRPRIMPPDVNWKIWCLPGAGEKRIPKTAFFDQFGWAFSPIHHNLRTNWSKTLFFWDSEQNSENKP